MINPNRATSEDVLRRLKKASYERMRVELKASIELLMKDFEMSWDELGELLGVREKPPGIWWATSQANKAKDGVIWGDMTLYELNALAHVFSAEPYIIFRPRMPWTKT